MLDSVKKSCTISNINNKGIIMEILVYGLEKGEARDYMETLLATNCKNAQDIEKVKAAAAAAGFHSFRVTTYDGTAPNFAKAVNV
jgi:hypothetical protein